MYQASFTVLWAAECGLQHDMCGTQIPALEQINNFMYFCMHSGCTDHGNKVKESKVMSLCIALYHELISKELRCGPFIARGSHSFTCYPLTNHTCLYFPAAEHHRPLAGTHCAYPWRDGQAELTWVAGYILRGVSGTGSWTPDQSPIPVLTGPDIE